MAAINQTHCSKPQKGVLAGSSHWPYGLSGIRSLYVSMFAYQLVGDVLGTIYTVVSHVVYSSQWIDRNAKCRRAQTILAERSMRPTKIHAGGQFDLSLRTFVKVIYYRVLFIDYSIPRLILLDRYAKPPIHTSIYTVQWLKVWIQWASCQACLRIKSRANLFYA